jgi:molybdopterin-guanine dinucleotide biosynthesis protein A
MGGADKALVEVDGQPLIGRVIERLRPQVAALAISANGDPARFAAFGLAVLPDPVPGFLGPLAGVLAGLRWAGDAGAVTLVTAAADTPFLPRDLVMALRMAAHAAARPAAVAESPAPGGGWRAHPVFALWPVAWADEVAAALDRGESGLMAFLARRGAARIGFAADPFDPFFNVNTPADRVEAERIAREHGL